MWAVVPVKDLRHAKSRLAPLLNQRQRARLSLAMATDVLQQLCGVRGLAGVGVLSDDPAVLRLARRLGLRVWPDRHGGLNAGLRAVADQLSAEGHGIMVVPGDVPAARAEDHERLLAAVRPGVALVEAVADGGTNALVRDAGIDMPFLFGVGSFRAHLEAARAAGLSAGVAHLPRLQRDIDRPDDAHWLVDSGHDCSARNVLLRLHLPLFPATWKRTA